MAARKLVYLVFLTTVLSALGVGFNILSFVSTSWITGEIVTADVPTLSLNHGLMKGKESFEVGGRDYFFDLRIICLVGNNVCMFSCGGTKELRKGEIEDLYNLRNYTTPCIGEGRSVTSGRKASTNKTTTAISDSRFSSVYGPKDAETRAQTREKSFFLNYGLWLMTIVFGSFSTIFLIFSAALSLYNCFNAPSQPILSVYGLFIWNGISAVCQFFCMLMWGIAFTTTLKSSPAVALFILQGSAQTKVSLGWSYWILVLPLCFSMLNVGILKGRSITIYKQETKVRVVHSTTTSPDQLLF